MAINYEIKCIKKTNRMDPHERITDIGGITPGGGRWTLPQQDAIRGIESGKWHFFVNQAGKIVDVEVAVSAFGNKYLKTVSDGVQPNNLLSLPECP